MVFDGVKKLRVAHESHKNFKLNEEMHATNIKLHSNRLILTITNWVTVSDTVGDFTFWLSPWLSLLAESKH